MKSCLALLGFLAYSLIIFAVVLVVSYWYSQHFPASRGWLFLAVALVFLMWAATFRRALYDVHSSEQQAPACCGMCGQASDWLEWCTWTEGVSTHHTWLCRDCQNRYRAVAEA
jgi:hypothetical protein